MNKFYSKKRGLDEQITQELTHTYFDIQKVVSALDHHAAVQVRKDLDDIMNMLEGKVKLLADYLPQVTSSRGNPEKLMDVVANIIIDIRDISGGMQDHNVNGQGFSKSEFGQELSAKLTGHQVEFNKIMSALDMQLENAQVLRY